MDGAVRRMVPIKLFCGCQLTEMRKKIFPTPVLTERQALELNEMLKLRNAKLIVKIHPLQKLSGEMKNIHI